MKMAQVKLTKYFKLCQVQSCFSPQEIALFSFLFSENDSSQEKWNTFWEVEPDYENLPFNAKELMPAAMRKAQQEGLVLLEEAFNSWNLLNGLPKYVWTKNLIALNELKKISSKAGQKEIDFIITDGLSDILASPSIESFRAIRNLDILIKPEDSAGFDVVLTDYGWRQRNKPGEVNFQYFRAFLHPSHTFEIRVYTMVLSEIPDGTSYFTRSVWKHKTRVDGIEIPSLSHRLVLSAAHLYDMDNWRTGSYGKYLADLSGQLKYCQEDDWQMILKLAQIMRLERQLQETVYNLSLLCSGLPSFIAAESKRTGAVLSFRATPLLNSFIVRFNKSVMFLRENPFKIHMLFALFARKLFYVSKKEHAVNTLPR